MRLPHNPYTGRGVVIGEGKPENQASRVVWPGLEMCLTLNSPHVCCRTTP